MQSCYFHFVCHDLVVRLKFLSSIDGKLLFSLSVPGPCSEAEMSSIDAKLLLSLCIP